MPDVKNKAELTINPVPGFRSGGPASPVRGNCLIGRYWLVAMRCQFEIDFNSMRFLFHQRFPFFIGALPLLGVYWFESPCYRRYAILFFLGWGYLSIAIQLLRGESYDRFGFYVEHRRVENPRAYWLTLLFYAVLWILFHVFVVARYFLPNLTCA